MIGVRLQTRLIAVVLTLTLWAVFLVWRFPNIDPTNSQILYRPNLITSLPLCFVFAYGLSTLMSLFIANYDRLNVVLYPNTGRMAGAVILMLFTPVAMMDWIPWIVLGVVPFMIFRSTEEAAVLVLLGFALWYLPSCLLVSGVKNRWLRFWLFCLMFWSACAAVILFSGVLHLSV